MRLTKFNCWSKHLTWIRDIKRAPDVDLTLVRGGSGLVPIGTDDGAVLVWMFDNKPGTHQYLFVRLTEHEADLVNAADAYTVGLLEPVRRRIKNRWALLMVKSGRRVYGLPYRIPRYRSESAFIADLDMAAATCPAYRMNHSREIARDAQVYAENMARELALA